MSETCEHGAEEIGLHPCPWCGIAEMQDRAERAEQRVAELEALVSDAFGAIEARGQQIDAEFRDHDKRATRFDDKVRAWQERARAALKGESREESK